MEVLHLDHTPNGRDCRRGGLSPFPGRFRLGHNHRLVLLEQDVLPPLLQPRGDVSSRGARCCGSTAGRESLGSGRRSRFPFGLGLLLLDSWCEGRSCASLSGSLGRSNGRCQGSPIFPSLPLHLLLVLVLVPVLPAVGDLPQSRALASHGAGAGFCETQGGRVRGVGSSRHGRVVSTHDGEVGFECGGTSTSTTPEHGGRGSRTESRDSECGLGTRRDGGNARGGGRVLVDSSSRSAGLSPGHGMGRGEQGCDEPVCDDE
jgi:hypothetical protein